MPGSMDAGLFREMKSAMRALCGPNDANGRVIVAAGNGSWFPITVMVGERKRRAPARNSRPAQTLCQKKRLPMQKEGVPRTGVCE